VTARTLFSRIPLQLPGTRAPVNVHEYERAAKRRLPKVIWDYIEGGAEDEQTVAANRAAFGRWALRPRILVDVSKCDASVTVCGHELAMPVLVAPTGLSGLTHHEGDCGLARAAEACGTRAIVSTASNYSIEEVAAATEQPPWFQLYPWGDRDVTGTFIDRAQRAGYAAMVVTVDVPIHGNRERDARNGMVVPPKFRMKQVFDVATRPRWWIDLSRHRRTVLANLAAPGDGTVQSVSRHNRLINPALDWDELKWMRDQWTGPLLVKGVLDPADAVRAVDAGANGVVVSNHGGRQLDGAVASLDALPPIVAEIGDRATVLVDGGIRRGSDVVKALALGADAVLTGRATLYGLATSGEGGVAAVLGILRTEVERTLALLGCPRARDVDSSYVVPNGA
jgi:isopentenyl diphosphate isomerase/L-lactate dehydrogenase-like FMN-dependent dehydrogenase